MEATSDKHYETPWESPLWKMIKQRADEKDISYSQAWKEVSKEHFKMLRYRDTEFEDAAVKKMNQEMAELREKEKKFGVGG